MYKIKPIIFTLITFMSLSVFASKFQKDLIFADENLKQRIRLFTIYHKRLTQIKTLNDFKRAKNSLIKTGIKIMRNAIQFTKMIRSVKKDEKRKIIETLKKRNLITKLRFIMRKAHKEQKRIQKIPGAKKIIMEMKRETSKHLKHNREQRK